MTQGQFFKRSLTGLNSEFSLSKTSFLTKTEEPSLPYYLSIAGGRIIGFIPFPTVLVLCEMLSVLSRNWTRIAVSISCDDNHYTTTVDRLSIIWKSDLSDKIKCHFFKAAAVSIRLYEWTTWALIKPQEKKLDGNCIRMLPAVLKKSWKQHPAKQ